jgi:hypothetical protein
MPTAALLPLILLVIAFDIFCLYDLRRSRVRYLPRWGWALVIIFFTFGGVVYLVAGREQT